MYSEKYNASAQRVLVAGPAYSHISWPGTLLGTLLGRVSQKQIAPRNGVLLGTVCSWAESPRSNLFLGTVCS